MEQQTAITTPNLGGRPSKFTPEILQKAEEYYQDCLKNNQMPYIEKLALHLDLTDETINEYRKMDRKFSATLNKIKMLQRMLLQHAGLASKVSVPMAIFLLKANHGMIETDRHEHTGQDGQQLQFNIIAGNGFLPTNQRVIDASESDIVSETREIQSTSVASESTQNDNSNNGTGEASSS